MKIKPPLINIPCIFMKFGTILKKGEHNSDQSTNGYFFLPEEKY
jgi:hypothetical protein